MMGKNKEGTISHIIDCWQWKKKLLYIVFVSVLPAHGADASTCIVPVSAEHLRDDGKGISLCAYLKIEFQWAGCLRIPMINDSTAWSS